MVPSAEKRPVDLAISLTEDRMFRDGDAAEGLGTLEDWLKPLAWKAPPLDEAFIGHPVSAIHYGNEFCERLLPSPAELARAVDWTRAAGLALSLVTPASVTDSGVSRLRNLLRRLPAGSEVVVNDWGVMRLVRREFPRLEAIVGRVLCKMLKDPRIPSAQWKCLGPHGLSAPGFADLLSKLGITRMEVDMPPYATVEEFRPIRLNLSLHAPYGFATKGRICRVGSLNLEAKQRFAAGHGCRKECLLYVNEMTRQAKGETPRGLHSFQRGNTVFYRHSREMGDTLRKTVEAGLVDRIVVSGDWNENRGAHRRS